MVALHGAKHAMEPHVPEMCFVKETGVVMCYIQSSNVLSNTEVWVL